MATIRHGSTEVTGFRYGSTEVDAVYYGATEVFAAFEDGSLVIEDDTLDVDGGSTVNLRVKLGARPRSDVTVALSETSSLISLGDDSLTFTQDNWDTYQSVVVTAGGNRQAISLEAGWYVVAPLNYKWWDISGVTRPTISASLTPGAARTLRGVRAYLDGRAMLLVDTGQTDTVQADLSDAFEASGSLTIEAGSNSLTVALAGADTTEPYLWTPSNSAEVIAFHNALPSTNDSQAGTLTLRDYVPGDHAISLAASGPDEYSGVTGSATVTVG